MKTHSITAVFNKHKAFTADINGHKVLMDTTAEEGGDDNGPSPKRLMLASLAGCTGMDIVPMLNKMKVHYSHFSIDIDAHVREEYPKIYNRVKITYKIKMAEADKPKLEKAIALSQEKYCSVSAMFRSFAKLETEIIILD
jgi:putative redox protein